MVYLDIKQIGVFGDDHLISKLSFSLQETYVAPYLVVFLLVTERLKDNRNEKVQHYKCHEYDAGKYQKCAKHWVQIQDLQRREETQRQFN